MVHPQLSLMQIEVILPEDHKSRSGRVIILLRISMKPLLIKTNNLKDCQKKECHRDKK
jgi:hypothetical protein